MSATLARHWEVIRSAWQLERARRSDPRSGFEEFLPGALEIIERPASPLGRLGLWLLIGGVALALLWSWFGRLDIVVTAPGRVIVASRVKLVQPSELGVVRAIHVQEGQRVRAGQLLVELDPTNAGAEDAQARTGLLAAEIDAARNRAIARYLAGGGVRVDLPAATPGDVARLQRDLVRTQIADYEARRAVLLRARGEHVAERAAAEAEERKLAETLPLLDRQLDARRSLADRGYYSRLRVHELEEQRIERVRNMDVQRAIAAKAQAAIGGIDAQLMQLRSDLAASTSKELATARDNTTLRRNEIEKTAARRRLMQLRAPVAGTVQQLAVHTVGGVVEPAQQLMVIVPETARLIVETRIASKDMGFVRTGQPVRIKVDAFPFTDFGAVGGRVVGLARDSVEDEKRGLIYPGRVALDRAYVMDGTRRIPLTPGLSVTAEIRTGRRRIIQYLLSPIATRLDEAGRER
jgi:hemolysin D